MRGKILDFTCWDYLFLFTLSPALSLRRREREDVQWHAERSGRQRTAALVMMDVWHCRGFLIRNYMYLLVAFRRYEDFSIIFSIAS